MSRITTIITSVKFKFHVKQATYANVGPSALAPPTARLVSQHFTKALPVYGRRWYYHPPRWTGAPNMHIVDRDVG